MKPKFLNKTSKIYLVAPSFGCTTSPYNERLLKSIDTLKNKNIDVIIGDNVFKSIGKASSNTPINRAIEIHNAFKSDSDVVWSVGGGEVMVEILEHIDFELIKENPKWFVGFSDNTNLTYTISTICDIETIYGINAPNIHLMTYDSLDTWNMLYGKNEFKSYGKWQLNEIKENPLSGYNLDKKSKMIITNYNEPITGRLIGGCIDCLSTICGTKFDNTVNYCNKHKDEGIIFFLEACDLTSIGLRRVLFQLKNAGWFNYTKAFIFGRCYNFFDESFGITHTESIIDILGDLNVPIIMNADLGHLGPSLPIRCGALGTVKIDKNKLIIKYKNED